MKGCLHCISNFFGCNNLTQTLITWLELEFRILPTLPPILVLPLMGAESLSCFLPRWLYPLGKYDGCSPKIAAFIQSSLALRA
jgi:hypothetical protein